MYEKIKSAITKHLQDHRLVFWYDEGGKHRAVLDELQVPGTVLEVANNEWWIKYHVLEEQPSAHFLVYAAHAQPPDGQNWLLDLVLAGFAFSHDLSETYRNELGLGPEFRPFFAEHVSFFQNLRERYEPLEELIEAQSETPASLAVKMMGVLTAADAESRRSPRSFAMVLFDLAAETFAGGEERWPELAKFLLTDAFREELRTYIPDASPDIEPAGAVISVFREAWALERGEEATAARRNCRVLLHLWRDRYASAEDYAAIATAVEEALQVREAVKSISTSTLAGIVPGTQWVVEENESGVSYERLFASCLAGAGEIELVDPYIRNFHQVKNLFEFLQMVMKLQEVGDEVSVQLRTTRSSPYDSEQEGLLEQVVDSFVGTAVNFTYEISDDKSLHARYITTNTGWKITLDRGLDIFQPFDRRDAFSLQGTVQEARRCRAFEVTYLHNA